MAREADNLIEAVGRLERQPLRNIVLLKHIEAFRDHVSVTQVSDGPDTATLVLLDTTGSTYDRETYPQAAFVALISSDRLPLTHRLLRSVPARGNVVFKLASDGDRAVVAEHFPISRATSFLSFTGDEHATFVADSEVSVSTSASDGALRLFESQGHPRDWLLPLLASDRAFVCVLEYDAEPRSVCIAFENHRQIWEIGGVVTPSAASRPGLRRPRGANGARRTAAPQAGRAVSGERGQSAVDPAGHVGRAAAVPAAHPFPHVVGPRLVAASYAKASEGILLCTSLRQGLFCKRTARSRMASPTDVVISKVYLNIMMYSLDRIDFRCLG